nr:alanine racemase [Nocardia vinacea]
MGLDIGAVEFDKKVRVPGTAEPDGTLQFDDGSTRDKVELGDHPSSTEATPDPAVLAAVRGLLSICAPALPAHTDDWERRLLTDPNLLGDIAFAIGGPFHVMYPSRVAVNINGFQQAFEQADVDGVVYFGKKANKAACVARACAENGAGVDVSSDGELNAALSQGVRGDELMVTGPAKSDDLLWLAVRHRALIAVDSLDELDRLAAFTTPAAAARVLLRVLPNGSASRFGMTAEELDRAISVIGASGTVGHESIRLQGFSFHLSGYDAVARAEQADELITRCLDARTLGHPADTISIGGGFGVDYVPASAWSEFSDHANGQWFHAGKSFDSYYPYHFPAPGPAMLMTVLEHNALAERLRDNDIRLAVEPGRALLDRAGSSVFRVQGSKTRHIDGHPYRLLTVDGTSLSLSEQWFDSEYLPDPILWPPRPGELTPTCVGAASCLESDMLSWRRIPLPRRAEVGDLLIYPNTAGYQMDSNESAFHELPIPPKVVLHDTGDRLRWTLDAG